MHEWICKRPLNVANRVETPGRGTFGSSARFVFTFTRPYRAYGEDQDVTGKVSLAGR
jgi:hypothetical protein